MILLLHCKLNIDSSIGIRPGVIRQRHSNVTLALTAVKLTSLSR